VARGPECVRRARRQNRRTAPARAQRQIDARLSRGSARQNFDCSTNRMISATSAAVRVTVVLRKCFHDLQQRIGNTRGGRLNCPCSTKNRLGPTLQQQNLLRVAVNGPTRLSLGPPVVAAQSVCRWRRSDSSSASEKGRASPAQRLLHRKLPSTPPTGDRAWRNGLVRDFADRDFAGDFPTRPKRSGASLRR